MVCCDVLSRMFLLSLSCVFFFNDPAPTEIYTLSLHDALPICCESDISSQDNVSRYSARGNRIATIQWCKARNFLLICKKFRDRKSTRLNSSHTVISYAVFCLKKKKTTQEQQIPSLPRPTCPCI